MPHSGGSQARIQSNVCPSNVTVSSRMWYRMSSPTRIHPSARPVCRTCVGSPGPASGFAMSRWKRSSQRTQAEKAPRAQSGKASSSSVPTTGSPSSHGGTGCTPVRAAWRRRAGDPDRSGWTCRRRKSTLPGSRPRAARTREPFASHEPPHRSSRGSSSLRLGSAAGLYPGPDSQLPTPCTRLYPDRLEELLALSDVVRAFDALWGRRRR